MKPVIIIAIAFVLLIPIGAFAQYMGNVGSGAETGTYTLEEALELQKRRIEGMSVINNQPIVLSFIESDDFRTLAFNALPGEPGHNPDLRVMSGDIIIIIAINEGKSFHSFGIVSDPNDLETILWNSTIATPTNPLKPGEIDYVTFVAGAPGTYYYICTVPGHALQGMQGSFIVEPTPKTIPDWIKNIFLWYGQDIISENELLHAIKYLIDKEILVVHTPGGPGTEPLGSAHDHAAIIVNIFGDEFDFSAPAYQIKSSWIHFEGRDGSTIHKHATGVTLGYLFGTMSLGLDDQCFVFQNGKSFCTNEDYTLQFFINREQVSDIREYEIIEGDRILILFGSQTSEEIQAQLDELEERKIIG